MADDQQAPQDSTGSPDDVAVVWVDARHAAIVRWEDEPVVEWIESGVPRRRKAAGSVRRGPARPEGGGRVGGPGTEQRHREAMRRFFSDVADRLAHLDHVEVLGRGEPHREFGELLNRLADRMRDGLTVTTRSLARRPSERQLAARLRRLTDRSLPRRASGPYRPEPPATQASGRVRRPLREDLPNQKPRHLPERQEIDQEVEMMLAGDHPIW